MAEKKLVRWTIALAAALVLVIAAGYSYWTRGVYVKITNNTQNTLKHTDITYSVGVIHIAELVPGASYGRYVNPKGGSDLSLEWSDFSGKHSSDTLGVYFEHNYAGSVEIAVEPDNRVSVVDKIRLFPIGG
jgi:hypothetical protein